MSRLQASRRGLRAAMAAAACAIGPLACAERTEPAPSVALRAASSPIFPVKASGDGRYLVDQNGTPFRVQGDAAWEVCTDINLTDLRTYLDSRQSNGFNTILVQITNPVEYVPSSVAPASTGAGGALPFLKNSSGGTWDGDPTYAENGGAQNPAPGNFDAAFSSPNDTYFAWIDTLLNEAGSRGFLVLLAPCYLGYNDGAEDGWWRTLINSVNTQDVSYGFGQYLGNRYKSFPNILWVVGGDMMPPAGSEGEARALKMLQGIQAAGDTHPVTGHWVHDYLSTDDSAFAPFMTVEGIYTHGNYPAFGPTYARARLGYSHSPALPTVLLETTYEGTSGLTAPQLREYMWGAALSTVAGAVYGSSVWVFAGTPWKAQLSSTGTLDMERLGTLFDSIPWYNLVPSGLAGMKTLVVAGTGTYTSMPGMGNGESGGDDWVVSAATPDGNYLVAYVPDAHTGSFAVDLTVLSGSRRARWYDPTNGSYTAIGTVSNTGTQDFSTPGANSAGAMDWLLVVDPITPSPTVATAAAATPNPVTGTIANVSVLGADSGGEANLTYTWAATGTPPGPVTFSPNGTNASKSATAAFAAAGAYTLQATIMNAAGGSVTSAVAVTVNQALTAITVTPANPTIVPRQTQAFVATATDQFNAPLSAQPTFAWTVSGGGTITATGAFTAGNATGGPFNVTATGAGQSGTTHVSIAASSTVTLTPVADAFVRGSQYADTNFGQGLDLEVKTVPSDDQWTRWTYVKFPLGGVPASVASAHFRLYGGPGDTEQLSIGAYSVADSSWSETGITWNNKPAVATSTLSTVTVTGAGTWFDWDVTSYLQSEVAAGQNLLTLALITSNQTTADAEFSSRESGANIPQLVVTGSTDQPPRVATPAAATPDPVTGTTTNLSVLGADDGGEPSLTYTWAASGSPPAPVTFAANGTNASKSTTATFAAAGAYSLQATIADAAGLTVTSAVNVTVSQTLKAIVVTPANGPLAPGQTVQFAATATDQFGAPLSPQPAFTWSVNGGGTISGSGAFTAAKTSSGVFTVTATAGGQSGAVTVTVTATTTTTLTPVADAYVRGSQYAGDNYGAATDLQVKTVPNDDQWTRWTYFKFDLGSAPASVATAQLRLYGSPGDTEQVLVDAYPVADTTWTETGITWNNKPAAGSNVLCSATVTGTANQWFAWDVTSYVQSQLAAGQRVISLVLIAPNQATAPCDFSSREASSNGPQLLITGN